MAYIGFGSTSEASSFKLIDNISSQFNGAKVEFNLNSSGTPVTVHSIGMTFIIVNGLMMEPNVDYYLGSNFNTIQFTNAPTNGSSFQGRVIETTGITLSDRSVTKEKLSQDLFKPSVQKITVENNNTSNTFTLDEIVDRPEDISVYADGLYQRANTHYVIPTGTTIQFDTAPVGNTEIDIVYNTISTTVNRTEKSSSVEDFTSPNITVSDKLTSGRISVTNTILSGNITCQTLTANGDLKVLDTDDGSTVNFTVYANTGHVVAAGDVTSESDISLKNDIEDIENAIDIVKKLRGVTFNYKQPSRRRHEGKQLGVIAQEVEEHLPEVVSERNGIKNVAYGNIVALLIEAIKEMQEEIDKLKGK